MEITQYSQLNFVSAVKEDGTPIDAFSYIDKKEQNIISIDANRIARKGFFINFTLKPKRDLDDINDIVDFENSLTINVSIHYGKY